MATTTSPASGVLLLVATPVKWFLLAGALFAALLSVLSYETDYTRATHVESTVIAKLEGQPMHGHAGQLTLAVRNPDGTQQDIHPSRAQYTGTAVGDKIAVTTSPQLRDEPMPGVYIARTLVLIMLILAFAASFATALTVLVFGRTNKR
jgi:hypothetical protein